MVLGDLSATAPRPRVLHLLSSTGVHGAETMAIELVRQLADLGVDVHLMAFDNGDGSANEIVQEVDRQGIAAILNPCRGPLDRGAYWRLRDYVRQHRINVIHSHKYKTTFYAIAGRLMGRYRLVTTYHNWLCDSRSLRFYAWLDKSLAWVNDVAIAVSRPVAQELLQHMPASKVRQLGNGIDLSRFDSTRSRAEARRMLGLPSDSNVIGFVGRLSAEKGLRYLLDALPLIEQAVPRLKVLIAGDGPERRWLADEIRARGLAETVHLLGNRKDTPDIYAAMNVFVLPSILEAFPMVLLEAMACQRPVVATDVGEVTRIVSDDHTGRIVPPGQSQALANALVDLLSHPEILTEMGAAAQLHARKNFSSRAVADQYRRIYLEALAATA